MNRKDSSKSYPRRLGNKTKKLLSHPSIEGTTEQKATTRNSLWSNFHPQVEKVDRLLPNPAKQRILLAILAFVMVFTSLCIFTLPTFAASQHSAHPAAAAVGYGDHNASTAANNTNASRPAGLPWYCFLGPLSLIGKKCRKAPECSFLGVIGLALDPRCTAGGVAGPWEFPCSDAPAGKPNNIYPWTIDWLSGDPAPKDPRGPTNYLTKDTFGAGHFFVTYPGDTYDLPGVQKIYGDMEGLGFLLITPVLILLGYQLLWSSWTFQHAGALEAIPSLLLSGASVAVSFQLIQMLIALENTAAWAVFALHLQLGFPTTTVNGTNVDYILPGGDSPWSLRAIIMPISRWGCAANDFLGLLASKLMSDTLASMLPFFGGLAHLGGNIKDGLDLLKHISEFGLCIMSIAMFGQVLFRIVLLNYYILMCPVALGCWALPKGVGQGVVSQWFKGFMSLLFVQVIQIFVAVTLPWILPSMPNIPSDGTGFLNTIFTQLPLLIIMAMILKVPKFMGTKATSAIAQAGTVAGGAASALAAAAYQAV